MAHCRRAISTGRGGIGSRGRITFGGCGQEPTKGPMSLRRVLPVFASVALGLVLIVFLIRVGKTDVGSTLRQLQHVSRFVFIKLVLLNGLLIYLSTEKWRIVDATLRGSSDLVPSRITSFAVSSAGMAMGLILPVQLGMAAARTFGTYLYGRALKRGTAGTVFEQSFDLLVVALLSVASGATWLCGGGGVAWTACASAMIVLAMLAVEPAFRLVQRLPTCKPKHPTPDDPTPVRTQRERLLARALGSCSELMHSNAVSASLARRLLLLSTVRFGVVVLMAGQTAEAIHSPIPLWQMGAAIPFVFGVQWALANRVLGIVVCYFVAACALAMLGVERIIAAGTLGANGKTGPEKVCSNVESRSAMDRNDPRSARSRKNVAASECGKRDQ